MALITTYMRRNGFCYDGLKLRGCHYKRRNGRAEIAHLNSVCAHLCVSCPRRVNEELATLAWRETESESQNELSRPELVALGQIERAQKINTAPAQKINLHYSCSLLLRRARECMQNFTTSCNCDHCHTPTECMRTTG